MSYIPQTDRVTVKVTVNQENNIILRIGPDKNGFWKIAEYEDGMATLLKFSLSLVSDIGLRKLDIRPIKYAKIENPEKQRF